MSGDLGRPSRTVRRGRFALIGACADIAVAGFSFKILTLFALILALGLVVDDAIVVLENIQRRIEAGENPLLASALDSQQVAFGLHEAGPGFTRR